MRCVNCEGKPWWAPHLRSAYRVQSAERGVFAERQACEQCGAVIADGNRWKALTRFGLDAAGAPLLQHRKRER